MTKVYSLGYKLFRKRKDGSYGPLFINRKAKLLPFVEYEAEDHPTKGYAHRPGWHICGTPSAPHLSKKNRVWCMVAFSGETPHLRPENQGGLWYTAKNMMIIGELE